MSATKADGRSSRKGRNKNTFDIYREGGSTAEILLTVQLVLAARRWRSLLDEKLRPIEQSSARMEAMSAILNSPDMPAQVDIAKRLRIEGPTLTRMLDTLEKDGLVDRIPDPTDRRSKQLRLTDDGEEALAQIFDVAEVYRSRLLDDVDPETMAVVNSFLRGLLAKLDSGLPGVEAAE